MKGIIINYRMGRHRIYPNHVIIKLEGVEDKSTGAKYIGKKVVWV
ncbi:MAG: 50S ribosomal protein L35ae, partial [Nanopusillaceae archaeon]